MKQLPNPILNFNIEHGSYDGKEIRVTYVCPSRPNLEIRLCLLFPEESEFFQLNLFDLDQSDILPIDSILIQNLYELNDEMTLNIIKLMFKISNQIWSRL